MHRQKSINLFEIAENFTVWAKKHMLWLISPSGEHTQKI